ncbi:uncharacterized protein [Littorina saxatilis]|uniref:uncharacterized protein n=1 Tax=Littorina saxatilis TaxID=31220 RepID=UPI0038B54526
MYVTSQDPDDTHSTDHNHSTIALHISPNSYNGHPAAPHSLEADMYTTDDGKARHVPSYQASGMGHRSGGYEDIGFGSNGNTRAPQKDEYAVVDTSRAQKDPVSSANTSASSISSPAHTTEGSDEYAAVDESSSRNKATNVASGLSDAATNNAGADVYAQVNKTAKKVKVAEPEMEGAAYAQVQKPKPSAKPKTLAKPSSDEDEAQRGAEDDDEYHTLSHTRGSPHTQDQVDLESEYSHIGHD